MTDPATEFDRFPAAVLAKLGGRQPLDVLHATLAELTAVVRDAPAERWAVQPAPDEWSAWQTLLHLADTEMVYSVRLRMILTQERPMLVGFDQAAWADRLSGLDAEPAETFARWQVIRKANLRLYPSLDAAEWTRVGRHNERGEESIQSIVALLAGHDLAHLGQLRRALGV
ncbi:MAG: hypothetical protein NVSMB42_09590 [Herpetosiphon sp.]